MESAKRKNNFVQSVDRAVTLMELLSRRGWSGVTEVARELGINKSTAYRLLTTLRDRGLVEQDAATEKYRLGFGIVQLASTVRVDLDILHCSRPICARLSERTGETVTVAVLEGDDAVVIHQDIARSSALNVDWTGRHTPLHATAAGKIFLAYMPEEQRSRILSRKQERFTENTLVAPGRLSRHLEQVRKSGYARTFEELEDGLNAVGVPIYGPEDVLLGAISVSGPAFRMPDGAVSEVVALLKEAASETSRCLGRGAGQ